MTKATKQSKAEVTGGVGVGVEAVGGGGSRGAVKKDSELKQTKVPRQVHILNEDLIRPFLKAWLETTLNFLLMPLSYAIVWLIRPLSRLLGRLLCLFCLRCALCRSNTRVTGHETFWLAQSHGSQSQHRIRFASVAVLTLKETISLTNLKSLIAARVVEATHPKKRHKLHPRFSQRLASYSCGRIWVNDKGFDIDNHVVEHSEEIKNSRRLMELAAVSSMTPFMEDRPRWRVKLVPSFPYKMSTVIFSCDPSMADGVYLLNVLHSSLADEAPKEYARRHFGSFNQGFDYFRSIFGGMMWFFKNLRRFADTLDLSSGLREVGNRVSSSSHTPVISSRERISSFILPSLTTSTANAPLSPFPSVQTEGAASQRRFLVYGPIALNKIEKAMDVTKATVDEIILASLSSSIRDYLHHTYGHANPKDVATVVSVALQSPPLFKAKGEGSKIEDDDDDDIAAGLAFPDTANRNVNVKLPPADAMAEPMPRNRSPAFEVDLVRGSADAKPESRNPRLTQWLRPGSPRRPTAQQNLRAPVDESQTPSSPENVKVTYHKPRSFSVGVVGHQPASSSPSFLSAQNAHTRGGNNNNNNAEKLYAKTIEVPAQSSGKSDDFDDYYTRSKSSKLTTRPRLSFMKIYLPVSIEGILPTLWNVKYRILESKTSSDHVAHYKCCNFFDFLPENKHRRLMKRMYGDASVTYHSLVGSKTRLTMGGNPIRNIFFWGPMFSEKSMGVSFMTYLNSVTVTLNVAEDVQNPEQIFHFFAKKLEDMKEMLQFRRIRQQPRMDTILVPFGRFSSWHKDIVDDVTGSPVELRRHRSGRLRTSFTTMRRSSMAVLTSLVGTSRSVSTFSPETIVRKV